MDEKKTEAIIIGGAIADVILQPVDEGAFLTGSYPVDNISLTLGGDALNESVVLARLGHAPMLVTRLGRDAVAQMIRERCRAEGVEIFAAEDGSAPTGINAVLVKPDGERSFITNRNGTLRKLAAPDVRPAFETEAFRQARIVCLASLFVSPMLGIRETAELLAQAKGKGKTVCADMTRPKQGETARMLQPVLRSIDYLFGNLEEVRTLTGAWGPEECAGILMSEGAASVIIKLGPHGCLFADTKDTRMIPAFQARRCIDTTGAGDTFAAGFMAALLEGRSAFESARYASAAASLCVEELGATAAKLSSGKVRQRMELPAEQGDSCRA